MGKFAISVSGFTTSTTVTTSLATAPNAAGETGEVVEAVMTGSGGHAAVDVQHRCQVTFCTFGATGVSTTVTPEPFHQGTRASQFIAGATFTTEPSSYSGQPSINFGFNQRGGMRWAVPQGEGLILIGGFDDEGVGLRVLSSGAGNVDGHMHFWEAG